MFVNISNFNKFTYDYFNMVIHIISPNLFLAKYINIF